MGWAAGVVVQDLSKITMPVAVNEPLSFLQRMVEYLEYAHLLCAASQTDDPVHRLEVGHTHARPCQLPHSLEL